MALIAGTIPYYTTTAAATTGDTLYAIPWHQIAGGVTYTPIYNQNNQTASWTTEVSGSIQSNYLRNYKLKRRDANNWFHEQDGTTTSGAVTSTQYVWPQTATGWITGNILSNTFVDKRISFLTKIRANLASNVKCPALLQHNSSPAELRARMLLRDMVGDAEFRRYLRRGFIMVKGRTGVLYRIAGGHDKVQCYNRDKDGKYVWTESLCCVFKDSSLPYTDATIMRKILIENDEFAFRKSANVWKANVGSLWPAGIGEVVATNLQNIRIAV